MLIRGLGRKLTRVNFSFDALSTTGTEDEIGMLEIAVFPRGTTYVSCDVRKWRGTRQFVRIINDKNEVGRTMAAVSIT